MPQGGLDEGEDAAGRRAVASWRRRPASPRDMVEIVARCPVELLYDLPDDLVGKVWKGKWRGQRQTWFLAASSAGRGREHRDRPTPNSAPGNGPSRPSFRR